MNNNNSINSIKELLNAAINKNQVTFSHVAKIAENVGSGLLKVKLNESGKSVDFEYMNKKISIDLNRFRINGVKYLNDLLVDDIMTKVDLSQFEELINQIREELEAKTRLITSITDYPFCIFDTPNRTQVLIGHDLHNCINIGHNTEEGASFIANSPYGASIDLSGNTVKCNKNLTVPGTITSPTIDNINRTIQLDQSLISEHEARIYNLEEATNDVDFKNMNNLIYENQVKIAALETHNHDYQYAAKDHSHNFTELKKDILKSIYPVGSIYTSMNSTSPATVFGFGTWSQIKDRFLYCTTSSKVTGGSKKITIDNLPAHTHDSVVAPDINGNPDGSADSSTGTSLGQCYWRGNKGKTIAGGSAVTSSTGSGTDYLPPYITVYAWHRTA